MDGHSIIIRFAHNHLTGTNYKGDLRGSSFWFRGKVFYINEKPLQRIMQGRDGEHFMLAVRSCYYSVPDVRKGKVKHHSWYTWEHHLPALTMPTIGVFSPWENDMLEGYELHKHIRNSVECRLLDHLRDAKHAHIGRFIPGQYGSDPAGYFVQEANTAWNHFEAYRQKVALALAPIDQQICEDTRAIIARRVAEYNEPKAVQKRERARAKRDAIKALGLDE